MTEGRYIAYYRVSTAKQGRSGLGLDAQRAAVSQYLNGGVWTLDGEFVEIESGKRTKNRPRLAAAMAQSRLIGATLIIAKLDRLSRNVAFLANLMETGVTFVACDNPHATPFTLHILSAVAELEAKQISARTKAALAQSKKKLGGYRGAPGRAPDGRLGVAAKVARADDFAARVMPTIAALKAEGKSLYQMALDLTARGVKTPRGNKRWQATTVRRVLARSPLPQASDL